MTMTTNDSKIVAAGELEKIVGDEIPQGLAKNLLDTFAPLAQKADDLARESKRITVTDATQVSAMRDARKARLALSGIRCDAENRRKEFKADFLKAGRIIDNIAKHVAGLTEDEEARLLECEKFAERAEAAAKAKLAQERTAELAPFGLDLAAYNLGDMKPDAYATLIEGAKAQKARREREAAEAKAAEEKRLAEEAAERARVAAENARLRAERDAAEAAAAETRRKAEAERAEAERVSKAERDALEAKAAKERAAAARKLAEERAERERLQREADARAKAEAYARAEAERKERAAAAAPDAEKLMDFAMQIEKMRVPDMATEAGVAAARRIRNMLNDVAGVAGDMSRGLASGGGK